MPEFIAEMRFRFQAESLESAGAHLRRLSKAAEEAEFTTLDGAVVPAPGDAPADSGDWHGYAPT